MTGQDEVGRTLRSLLLEETNAMPVDTREAAEGLRRRLAQTRKRRRVTLAVAASVAAAVVVTVAATAGRGWLGADKEGDPAQNPTQNPAQVQAETVARDFLDAYGRFDADTALTYLTDEALVQAFETPEQLRLEFAWQRAHGYKQTIRDCSKEGDSASRVSVICTFDLHSVRSDEIGLGPYEGNYWYLTVRDGKIDSVELDTLFGPSGFGDQVWRSFAAWVTDEHPDDVLAMYTDESQTTHRASEDSVRLWEQRTAEYATVVKQDPAAHLDQPKVAAYVAQIDSICAAARARVRDEIQAIPQPHEPAVIEARDRIERETISKLPRSSVPDAVRWPYVGRVFPLMEKFYEYEKFNGDAEPPHDKQPPEWLARQIQQTPGLDKCIFPV
jgi:hypothetical protein